MNVTKITQVVTINAPGKDIVFDGFDFTESGYVKVQSAQSVTFRNCRVYSLNTESSKKNYWLIVQSGDSIKLVVENCYFGDSLGSAGALYNFIEPNAVLVDGSGVCENYFTKDVCTHNAVNIYGAAEGAKIYVSDNVFEASAGTVRIGMKGAPACEIEMSGNKVLAGIPSYGDDYQGLAMVQPYGKQTSSFENVTIAMNGNTCPGEQLIYAYSGSNDTTLTADNMPTIFVDGAEINAPIYH